MYRCKLCGEIIDDTNPNLADRIFGHLEGCHKDALNGTEEWDTDCYIENFFDYTEELPAKKFDSYSLYFKPVNEVTWDLIHEADEIGGMLERATGDYYDWHDLKNFGELADAYKFVREKLDGVEIEVFGDKFLSESYCGMTMLLNEYETRTFFNMLERFR